MPSLRPFPSGTSELVCCFIFYIGQERRRLLKCDKKEPLITSHVSLVRKPLKVVLAFRKTGRTVTLLTFPYVAFFDSRAYVQERWSFYRLVHVLVTLTWVFCLLLRRTSDLIVVEVTLKQFLREINAISTKSSTSFVVFITRKLIAQNVVTPIRYQILE